MNSIPSSPLQSVFQDINQLIDHYQDSHDAEDLNKITKIIKDHVLEMNASHTPQLDQLHHRLIGVVGDPNNQTLQYIQEISQNLRTGITFSELPEEVIIEILKRIDFKEESSGSLRLVSKDFARFMADYEIKPRRLATIFEKKFPELSLPLSIEIAKTAGPFIKTLAIYNRKGEKVREEILSLIEACPNLETLALLQIRDLRDDDIEKIASHCRHLKSLVLGDCHNITRTGIEALAQMKNLESLRLIGFESLNGEVLKTLAQNMPKLSKLIFGKCSIDELESAAPHLANLQELTFAATNAPLTETVASHLKNLRVLTLTSILGGAGEIERIRNLFPHVEIKTNL